MLVKDEITNIVDSLPEEILKDLLEYLRKLELDSKEKPALSINLKTILAEDNSVLTKLAQ